MTRPVDIGAQPVVNGSPQPLFTGQTGGDFVTVGSNQATFSTAWSTTDRPFPFGNTLITTLTGPGSWGRRWSTSQFDPVYLTSGSSFWVVFWFKHNHTENVSIAPYSEYNTITGDFLGGNTTYSQTSISIPPNVWTKVAYKATLGNHGTISTLRSAGWLAPGNDKDSGFQFHVGPSMVAFNTDTEPEFVPFDGTHNGWAWHTNVNSSPSVGYSLAARGMAVNYAPSPRGFMHHSVQTPAGSGGTYNATAGPDGGGAFVATITQVGQLRLAFRSGDQALRVPTVNGEKFTFLADIYASRAMTGSVIEANILNASRVSLNWVTSAPFDLVAGWNTVRTTVTSAHSSTAYLGQTQILGANTTGTNAAQPGDTFRISREMVLRGDVHPSGIYRHGGDSGWHWLGIAQESYSYGETRILDQIAGTPHLYHHGFAAPGGATYANLPIAGTGGTLYVLQDIPASLDQATTAYRGARYRAQSNTEALNMEISDIGLPRRSTGVRMINGVNQWVNTSNSTAVAGSRAVAAVTTGGGASWTVHSIDGFTVGTHPNGGNTITTSTFQLDLPNAVVFAAYFPREHDRDTVLRVFAWLSRRYGGIPIPTGY